MGGGQGEQGDDGGGGGLGKKEGGGGERWGLVFFFLARARGAARLRGFATVLPFFLPKSSKKTDSPAAPTTCWTARPPRRRPRGRRPRAGPGVEERERGVVSDKKKNVAAGQGVWCPLETPPAEAQPRSPSPPSSQSRAAARLPRLPPSDGNSAEQKGRGRGMASSPKTHATLAATIAPPAPARRRPRETAAPLRIRRRIVGVGGGGGRGNAGWSGGAREEIWAKGGCPRPCVSPRFPSLLSLTL